jgi:hypothetical protein
VNKDEAYKAVLALSQKWPAARSVPKKWAEVEKLVRAGDVEKADVLARAIVHSRTRLVVRNKTAVAHRVLRREYLVWQREMEKSIEDVMRKLAADVGKWLVNAADDSGKIPLWKMTPLLDRLKKANRLAFAEVLVIIRHGIKHAVASGINNNMASAQVGLDHHQKLKESGGYDEARDFAAVRAVLGMMSVIVEEQRATMLKSSGVYQKIFDAVATRRIQQGLFKNRKRGEIQTGKPLSQSVWDIRDQHLRTMRDVVAGGIASGRSPMSVASDIKYYTVMGGQPGWSVASPGAGVYRTAYKNALRLARTETNNAYHEADVEYATQKGYMKMWNVSVGKRDEDECDDLAGQIFDPQDVPALPHPNCSCYLTTVIPEVS